MKQKIVYFIFIMFDNSIVFLSQLRMICDIKQKTKKEKFYFFSNTCFLLLQLRFIYEYIQYQTTELFFNAKENLSHYYSKSNHSSHKSARETLENINLYNLQHLFCPLCLEKHNSWALVVLNKKCCSLCWLYLSAQSTKL